MATIKYLGQKFKIIKSPRKNKIRAINLANGMTIDFGNTSNDFKVKRLI